MVKMTGTGQDRTDRPNLRQGRRDSFRIADTGQDVPKLAGHR